MKTIKVKFLKGEVGNTEWWTEKDWDKHRQYVKELKEKGEYLQEDYCNIIINKHSLFDKTINNSSDWEGLIIPLNIKNSKVNIKSKQIPPYKELLLKNDTNKKRRE